MSTEIVSQLIAVGGSIIGCVIGGLITYFCSYKTLKQERKIEQQNRIIEAKKARPRLIIKNVSKNSDNLIPDIKLQILKINNIVPRDTVPFFEFVGDNVNENKMSHYDFEFENEGHSEICDLDFTTTMSKYFNIINFDSRDYYIKNRIPNIDVTLTDLCIKPGDRFRLRIYFSKELLENSFLPNITFWALDSIDYLWMQTLYLKEEKISNSRLDRYNLYKAEMDIDGYISYFKETHDVYKSNE